jgi:hypothetical protein
MTTRYSLPVDVAASGLVVRESRQPLARCNLNKKKDLNRAPGRCYALRRLLDGRLSQNVVELPDNMPVVRAPFPR